MVLTGCVNPDGTQNNTGSRRADWRRGRGAHRRGHWRAAQWRAGALIGAAAGAVGRRIDRQFDGPGTTRTAARGRPRRLMRRVDQGQPLSVADVKALAKAGISEDVIISQIQNSHTVYHLSAADIIDLRNSGVRDKVVNYMINTPEHCRRSAPVATQPADRHPTTAAARTGGPVVVCARAGLCLD